MSKQFKQPSKSWAVFGDCLLSHLAQAVILKAIFGSKRCIRDKDYEMQATNLKRAVSSSIMKGAPIFFLCISAQESGSDWGFQVRAPKRLRPVNPK